jgi:hypothetical protein
VVLAEYLAVDRARRWATCGCGADQQDRQVQSFGHRCPVRDLWLSHSSPFQESFRLFCPVPGPLGLARGPTVLAHLPDQAPQMDLHVWVRYTQCSVLCALIQHQSSAISQQMSRWGFPGRTISTVGETSDHHFLVCTACQT